VTEITRLPRIGPAFAQRIVDWRDKHGPFGGLSRFDSVPGVGPKLLESLRSYVMFSGVIPARLDFLRRQLCYAVHFQRVAYGDRSSHLRQAG